MKLMVLTLLTFLVAQNTEREKKWEDALKNIVQFTHSCNRLSWALLGGQGPSGIRWWMSSAQSCGARRNSKNSSPPLPRKVRKCHQWQDTGWVGRDELEFAKETGTLGRWNNTCQGYRAVKGVDMSIEWGGGSGGIDKAALYNFAR